MKTNRVFSALLALLVIFYAPLSVFADAATASLSDMDKASLAVFEKRAALAKEMGATHVIITENLPAATWQFVPADDPYPAWYIERPDFFKIFPPKEVQPFVDLGYARRVAAILTARSSILHKLGLKAHWSANIPQVMPEAFFTAYPQLRGPRVDQPNRSRTPRFSLCVDEPETLRLYREAMQSLLAACPDIETFSFLTQDSGSGFCWAPSLYPGLNGNSQCKDRPMAERVAGFLIALQTAAKDSGRTIELSLNPIEPRQWMIPTFSPEQSAAIVARLPRGISLAGREGPDGRPFQGINIYSAYVKGAFHPVLGLAVPDFSGHPVSSPMENTNDTPTRRVVRIDSEDSMQGFSLRLQRALAGKEQSSRLQRLATLRTFAASEVGEAQADDLIELWTQLNEAQIELNVLNFGDMLQFGHVLNRWINRPMVPFPEELTAADKADYRRFLFQAKGEKQAGNLIDIQAMRMFEGYGARLLFQRAIETIVPKIRIALTRAQRVRDGQTDATARKGWDLMGKRLQALIYLLNSADNMVGYQAQLDRVKALGVKPESDPVLGVQNSWDRTDLMEIARKEIDNTVALMRLLQSTPEPILDLAATPEEETIMRLGPNLVAQLKHKVDIMNAHWLDYDRLFTAPNP